MTRRDASIDIARGLAVFLMIQANVGSVAYQSLMGAGVHAYVMVASFVPALFITLAGALVAFTAMSRSRTLRHFLVRMVALLITAAVLIDLVAWRIVPFVGLDVLYVIAISLPIAFVFTRLSGPLRWLAVVAVFLLTPVIQRVFGYGAHVYEIPIHAAAELSTVPIRMILGQWVVDGWFPIFPWVGFALLGVNLGLIRWSKASEASPRSFAQKRVVGIGALLVAAGVVLWMLYDGPLYSRQGFIEKIYPPTLAYIVTASGEMLLLLALFDWNNRLRIYHPLRACSESALFIYILHHLFLRVCPRVDTAPGLLLLLAASLLVVFAVAYLLRFLRRRWTKRPALLRMLLGI
jgi:uncharacterized membrane protein